MSEQGHVRAEYGGEERVLALKPRAYAVGDARCSTGVVGLGDAPAIIPRNDLPPVVDLSAATGQIDDQDGHSTCHSYAGAGVVQSALYLAGHGHLPMSMAYLVHKVTGGRDDGAAIDEVMEAVLKYGVCLRATQPGDNYGRPAAAVDEEAKLRIPVDVWDCGHDRVMEALLSCLAKGFPVELGTNAFGGGHAVRALGYFTLGGVIYPFGPNSWGERYTSFTSQYLAALRSLLTPEQIATSHVLATEGRGYWCFPEHRLSNVDLFGAFGVQSMPANKREQLAA